jgi:predicted transglutaminase-like cysteine proteinase
MLCRAYLSALLIGAASLAVPAQAAGPSARSPAPQSFLSRGPDMLGTRAVMIRADRFGESLKRAREDASSSPILQRLIAPARSLPPLQKMAFVQTAVTKSVHWISDATEWGQHDYWASASQTLAHGAGDAKNRAIVKLQALRALGFNNSDLFLTLARDKVGGPLTVLTVRSGGRYYIVDDSGGAPFPVEARSFEFQPIMSFGMYGAWVHARPTATLASAKADTSRGGGK